MRKLFGRIVLQAFVSAKRSRWQQTLVLDHAAVLDAGNVRVAREQHGQQGSPCAKGVTGGEFIN